MRKDMRGKRALDSEKSSKKEIYVAGTILIIGIIVFLTTIIVYSNKVNNISKDLGSERLGMEFTQTDAEDDATEEAGAQIGKSVDELEHTEPVNAENEEAALTSTESDNNTTENTTAASNTTPTIANTEPQTTEPETNENEPEPEAKELAFILPTDGTIMKEFAKDDLVYSETLKEWTPHTGIDIKADKTSVVKASEDGTVTAIKNDPRYGITVIIAHANGYETRYANLLTAEFVKIGENVTKGQTIGTVGNTASFEILDDFHLHFELLKDGEYENPTGYFNVKS